MSDQWRVKLGAKAHGPFTVASLQKLISSGKVTRETLISDGTSSDWVPAGSISLFFLPVEITEEWEIPDDSELPMPPQVMSKRSRRDDPAEGVSASRTGPGLEPRSLTLLEVLFDSDFKQYATPMLVKMAWRVVITIVTLAVFVSNAITIFGFVQMMRLGRSSPTEQLTMLVFVLLYLSLTLLGAVILLLYNRILCEIAIVAFDVSDSLKSIDRTLRQARE